MKEFCVKCGAANLFESSRPKFCGGCGSAFNRLDTSESSHSKASKSRASDDDDEDDDDEDYNPLNINKRELAKDWSADIPQQRIGIGSFQDLAINQSSPKTKLPPRAVPKDVKTLNSKNILKTVQQECAKVKTSREIG